MISFDWPWIFLLLPLPAMLGFFSDTRTESSVQAIRIPPTLAMALQSINTKRTTASKLPGILLWSAWACLLACIAQPWKPGDTIVQPVTGRAIAIAVDVSGSMERQDFSLDGKSSDRLGVVKRVAQDFIQQRRGDRLSLILYGRDAFIASPLTFDLESIGNILNGAGIGMAGRSTAIGDALGLSIKTLQNDPATSKAIVLLSDGTNNAGSVEPESAANLAKELGIRIHTIAMGSTDKPVSGYDTAVSADLDEDTLKAIAQAADGLFFRAKSTSDLRAVYSEIDKLERAEADAPPVILRDDLRLWPQVALLLCLLVLSISPARYA